MKNLKKALSLTLALALSLSLAVPAFAAGSTWNLSVQGKSDEEAKLPSATYKRLSWNYGHHDDNEYDVATLVKDEEPNDYKYSFGLIALNQGEVMVLTAYPSDHVMIEGWSDPDGDGVYEQVIFEMHDGSFQVWSNPSGAEFVSSRYIASKYLCLDANGQLSFLYESAESLTEEATSGGMIDVAISADYLLQVFGPNTLLYFGLDTYDPGNSSYTPIKTWNVYLSGDSRPSAPAEPEQPAEPSGISVTVDGTTVTWTDAVPFIDTNSRTMVPLRAVADAMGLDVNWDGSAREAAFTNGSKTIYFPIDNNTARTSDGGAIQMDTAAVIVNERTYAPIRYLAEYFGYEVGWDAATRTVTIK